HRTFTRWSVAGRTGHFRVRVLPVVRRGRTDREPATPMVEPEFYPPCARPPKSVLESSGPSSAGPMLSRPPDVGPGRRRFHCPARSAYFFRNRSCTYGGTRLDTSPLCWAISRTRLEERNEYCGFAVMNTVSTPESR